MKKFQGTRTIIIYSSKYISGKTLNLGAGISNKYAGIIRERAAEYVTFDTMPGAEIDVVGDALNLPFKQETFDTVISTQVLEHVEKPWVMVKEIHRVLKENGVCILTAPFLIPYHADPHDYFRYTKEGMESLFKDAGFKIVECDYYDPFFATLMEIMRFSFFNPYKKKRGVLTARFIEYSQRLAKFLDKFIKSDIVYANVYIIARK